MYHSKGNLLQPDIYLKCAREIAADGEGELVWQRNKKKRGFHRATTSGIFKLPLHRFVYGMPKQ